MQDGPTGTPIETYAYDAAGNRTSLVNAGGTQTYTYFAASHRLTSVAGIARTYNATGSTTSIGNMARQFYYTPGGRQRMVKRNGAIAMYYSYNGLGEQVRRFTSETDLNQRYYVYDEGGHWLGDYDSTGAPKQQIVWLDDLPVGLINAAGLNYIEPDHLGSPRAVIDPLRDVAVWQWDAKSEVFGNSPPDQDPDGDGFQLVFDMRFAGQRYDSATGLNYNYFRDYDPLTGRYVQSDPIGLRGGLSTYAYVSGNPVNRIDPFGLKDFTQCETNEILAQARSDVSGGLIDSTKNAYRNHTGFGKFDFKMKGSNDTFDVGSARISGAGFGNYIAGYSGYYYGGGFGYALVRAGGLWYDWRDDRRTLGDQNVFDWDADSAPDIINGAKRAQSELNGSAKTGCGCS